MLVRTLAEGWLETVDVPPGVWQPFNPGVDSGEAGAIRLACGWRDEGNAVLIVMDDRAGRLEARRQGIASIGTAAVIGLARSEGLIPAARPLLERLTRAGYYPGQAVIASVLAEVGE